MAGGLAPLQTAVILIALPFSMIMVHIAIATAKGFYEEHAARLRAQRLAAERELSEQISAEVADAVAAQGAVSSRSPSERARLPEVSVIGRPRMGALGHVPRRRS